MMRLLGLVLAVLLWSAPAWADGTIDTLSAGTTLTGTELLPMFQTANPAVTTTPNALKTFIGGGTVTSISAGCGSSTGGSAITTTGTIAAVETVSLQTGSNYPVTNANCGQLVDLSNAGAQTPTIAQAGSGGNFTSGWYADICNIGAGTQTLTPATSTINGAATLPIIKGMCYRVVSDGTNYQTVGAGTFGTTGSGNLVYATSPTLVTPILGTPTSVTLNNTSDVIGGVTMTLGSDATGDLYYRNSSGVLTRLAVCTGTNVLGASGGLPACVAQSGGSGLTVNSTTVSGGAAGNLLYTDGTLVQASTGVTYASSHLVNTQSIGATSTDGLLLTNTTAAANNAQQWAPRLHFSGQGWATTGSSSQAIDYKIEDQTVQGSSASGNLIFAVSVNGGGYSTALTIPSNANFLITNAASTGNAFTVGTNLTVTGGIIFYGAGNQSTFSSAAAATMQLGGANTSAATAPTAQFLTVQNWGSSTSADQNGANWTLIGSRGTGAGTAGNIALEVGKTGTTGTTEQTAFPLLTLNPGNATGATVQFGDGTNFTTYDSCTALTTGATGIVACTGSALRFKDIHGVVTPDQADAGLDKLRVGAPVWSYKKQYIARFGEGTRVGLIADDVAKMDPRCVVEKEGGVSDYWDRCVIAYLVADRQKMKAEIDQLKRRVR